MDIETNSTELLLNHLAGKLSSEEENEMLRELKKHIELRRDLYSLMSASLERFPIKVCPSDDLLTDFFFETVQLDDVAKSHLDKHIRGCQYCSSTMESLASFGAAVEGKKTEILRSFFPSESPLLKWLKGFAKATDYIDQHMVDPLFEQLEALSLQKRAAFAFPSVRGSSRNQRKFSEMLKKLLSQETELNELLEMGDRETIRAKLHGMLQDEELIDEMMNHIP